MNILEKIRNILLFSRLTLASKDDENVIVAQMEGLGKPVPVYLVYPYGFSANAPKDSTVIAMAMGGTTQNKAGIPTMPENRFANLKEWEVKVGNFKTKAHIFFNEDGDIRVENDNGYFVLKESGQFDANGNFTVDP
jgi:phage gp45-like